MADLLVVGINGSPHAGGNTAAILSKALKAAREKGAQTVTIECYQVLKGLPKPFCQGCEPVCTGQCYRDKELAKALELLSRADGIIMGSPVYFGTISAALKAFWDRTRLLRNRQVLLNTVGAAVAAGGARYGGQEPALKVMHDIMLAHGMIVVGDGYVGYDSGHLGAGGQSPIDEDEQAGQRARLVGMRVAEVANATRTLRRGAKK